MMQTWIAAKSVVGRLGKITLRPGAIALLIITAAVVAVGSTIQADHDDKRPAIHMQSPRLVVLKSKRQLHLFDGEKLVRTYKIDLGVLPMGQKHHQGDGRTPTGMFHIVTMNPNSPYHRFLGINYPNQQVTLDALNQGLISAGEAASIHSAIQEGRCPNWATVLGGGIGLHGGFKGEDWTGGCVAIADKGIDELFAVMRIGDPVEILP